MHARVVLGVGKGVLISQFRVSLLWRGSTVVCRVVLQQFSSEETRVLRGVVSSEGGHRQIASSVGMRSGFVATESGNHFRRQSHDQGLFCRALRVR